MAEVEDLTAVDEAAYGTDSQLEAQLEELDSELAEVKSQIEFLIQQQDHLRARRDQLLRQIEQERRAPKADWQQENFPWSAKLSKTLHDVFGLREFRPLQREVMNAALQGRDVLCLLPSGGGKSLCYQLPALVNPGLTLVVSPLLSLIQDQVLSLRALGINGNCLTSLSSKEDVAAVYGKMDRGELKLLYVTPEKIVSSKRFISKLEKVHQAGRLDRIAIDEAHCASQWGNDFRPDYKKLGILKQQFPQVPIMALTATATRQVCEDLKAILRIPSCEFFRASVNRPNLFYEVRPKPSQPADATAAIVAWIREHYPLGESGIVYCLTRKDCETVAAELVAGGVRARHYHADMEPGPREAAHSGWSDGSVQVMVATVAFGMGINKPDVRFVVHHSLSKSVENYYQESGRAGRDGLPARCLMFYRFSDALRQAAIVCFEPTWQPNLTAMMSYASAAPATASGSSEAGGRAGSGCRRAIIQRHFAEAPADCRCMCDNCCAAAGPALPPSRDVSRHVLAILGILRQQQAKEKKATLLQLVDLWRASKDAAVGKEAKAMTKDDNEAVVGAMMYSGLLEFEFGHTAYATNTYLKPSARGAQLLEAAEAGDTKQPKVLLQAPLATGTNTPGSAFASAVAGSGKKAKAATPGQTAKPSDALAASASKGAAAAGGANGDALRASLEQWRSHRARVLQVFPHSIMSGEQLAALSALPQPVPDAALREALGVRRCELYGKEIADVLAGRFRFEPDCGHEGKEGEAGRLGAKGKPSVHHAKGSAAPVQQQQVARASPEVVVLDDSDEVEEVADVAVKKAAKKVPGKEKRKGGGKGEGRPNGGRAAGSAAAKDVSDDGEEDNEGGEEDDGDDFEADVPLVKRRRQS